MLKTKDLFSDITWKTVLGFGSVCVVFYTMLTLIVPLRGLDLTEAYGRFALAALLGVYLCRQGFKGCVEVKLFFAYAAWVLVTRWLNGDVYLHIDLSTVRLAFESFLVFAGITLPDAKQRRLMLDIFAIVYVLFFSLAGIAGIFVALTNTYFHIPPEDVWITVGFISQNALNIFSAINTASSIWFFTAWALALYLLFSAKRLLWRVLLIIDLPLLHITLALCHCRAAQIALSVGYGMLAMLLVLRLMKNSPAVMRTLVMVVAAAAALALSFYIYKPISVATTALRAVVAPRFEVAYNALEHKPDPELFGIALTPEELAAMSELDLDSYDERKYPFKFDPTGLDMSDHRGISSNRTLSDRTYIWATVIPAVKNRPMLAVIGQPSKTLMDFTNSYLHEIYRLTETKATMHNMYIQAFMLLGLPGFLLTVAWTVLMVVKMIKFFFAEREDVCFAHKFLTVAVAGLLIYNLADVFGFVRPHLTGYSLFLTAGFFISFYNDAFPSKRGNG